MTTDLRVEAKCGTRVAMLICYTIGEFEARRVRSKFDILFRWIANRFQRWTVARSAPPCRVNSIKYDDVFEQQYNFEILRE